MAHAQIKCHLPVVVLREGKKYIAYTPALDLSTSGNTHAEAKNRFSEIVNIFFEEIVRKGTLNDVLRNLGWHKVKTQWKPPVLISQECHSVQVSA